MAKKSPYQDYKRARERRQTYTPLIMGGLAITFVAVGIVLIFIWARGGSASLSFWATDTPTPTLTPTPIPATATPTITLTPTITNTPEPPTETPIPTPSEPFEYTVLSGDSLFGIASQFQVSVVAIMLLNGLSNDTILYPGDLLTIPNPDMGLPTSTPLAPNLPRGSVIDYFVLPGDTLRTIAEKFLTTEDAIIEKNELEDPNYLEVGQILKVPVYLITPTFGPSATPETTLTPTPGG